MYGRTLIRLYKATSGSVYFKGYRIAAGNRWNEKEIKWSTIRAKRKIKALKNEMNEKIKALSDEQGGQELVANETAKIQAEYDAQIKKIQDDLSALVKYEKEKIAQAKKEYEKGFKKKRIKAIVFMSLIMALFI